MKKIYNIVGNMSSAKNIIISIAISNIKVGILILIIGIIINPQVILAQSYRCDILQQGIDLQSKQYHIQLAPDFLFNYTPPQIKNDLQSDNLINTAAQIQMVDDETILALNVRINSLAAPSYYGSIDPEAFLKITLINEKTIELRCKAGSTGTHNPDQKAYIYAVSYTLDKRAHKLLAQNEVDKIGIEWSSGYEEYTIYEVDFFINQIACLQQAIAAKPN